MSTQFKISSEEIRGANIKVLGVGGGGCNAINYMVEHGVMGVQFIAANTDLQALQQCRADTQLHLGKQTTRGLGAGMDPDRGRAAAVESEAELRELLAETDMLFITAGMGGGTGTGAAPEVAKIAKDLDILCVGVVTRPFDFEGPRRLAQAEQGIGQLQENVDSMIAIYNQRLTDHKSFKLCEAFQQADQVLHGAVRGVAELITRPGMINVDFADVHATIKSAGTTIIGNGSGSGDDAAQDAINRALQCPLLEDQNLQQAQGILFNVTANQDFISMDDFTTIGTRIEDLAAEDARVIPGMSYDNTLQDEIQVTVVATGLCTKTSVPRLRLRTQRRPLRPDGSEVSRPQQPERLDADYGDYDGPAILRRQAD